LGDRFFIHYSHLLFHLPTFRDVFSTFVTSPGEAMSHKRI
jgi:hypothetical protein